MPLQCRNLVGQVKQPQKLARLAGVLLVRPDRGASCKYASRGQHVKMRDDIRKFGV
jgi:hypothetical protein